MQCHLKSYSTSCILFYFFLYRTPQPTTKYLMLIELYFRIMSSECRLGFQWNASLQVKYQRCLFFFKMPPWKLELHLTNLFCEQSWCIYTIASSKFSSAKTINNENPTSACCAIPTNCCSNFTKLFQWSFLFLLFMCNILWSWRVFMSSTCKQKGATEALHSGIWKLCF